MKKLLIPLICFGSLFLFFPSLASTSLGQKIALNILGWKSNSRIQANSMRLSWLGPQTFFHLTISDQEMDASCKQLTAYMPLWRLSRLQGPFTISNGSARFHSSSCQNAALENLEASIEGNRFTAKGSARSGQQAGSFDIKGTLDRFPGDCSLEGRLISIPACLCDLFLKTDQKIEQILGSFLSLEGSIKSKLGKGSFNISLRSSHCQTNMHAEFDGQALRLNKPLTAHLTLTPALNDLLMRDINPLFLTSVQANHPIVLRLSPDNFSFPYAPFNLSSFSIGQASLDLGQVTLQSGPSLQSLLDLLNNRRLKGSRSLNAWFTPLTFKLQNGTLKTGRLDLLLANSVHLCTWGHINLQNSKLHMYLGLPAETLASSFGISGLHPDYVLKIPVRGTISKPELVTNSAIAQITAVAAAQKLPLPKVGKLFGKVVQGVAELKSDKDVPPAKRPFPWER